MSEMIDLDALSVLAERADLDDPDCWYDLASGAHESVTDNRFISAASPVTILALIRRIRTLEHELTYAATICETTGHALTSVGHWRELIERGTTK